MHVLPAQMNKHPIHDIYNGLDDPTAKGAPIFQLITTKLEICLHPLRVSTSRRALDQLKPGPMPLAHMPVQHMP